MSEEKEKRNGWAMKAAASLHLSVGAGPDPVDKDMGDWWHIATCSIHLHATILYWY